MTTYTVKQMLVDHKNLKKGDILVFDGWMKSEYFFIDLNEGKNCGWNRTHLKSSLKIKNLGTWEGWVGGAMTDLDPKQLESLKSFIKENTEI